MLTQSIKSAARRLLQGLGYDLVPLPQRRNAKQSLPRAALPEGAAEELRADHPRLRELRERYASTALPMARHTLWGGDYLKRELDLTTFRSDNAYVWQQRHMRRDIRYKYYAYLRELTTRDSHGLFSKLLEDGAFGCLTFDFPGWPRASRDLLDSINEIYFLHEHLNLLDRPGFSVLDIGAGYGRLAHRMLTAAPAMGSYVCVDAVAESTFLCEYYLRYRGLTDRAEALPLHELDARLEGRRFDLAVNIHSFSEMSLEAIEGWVTRIAALKIPALLVIPNESRELLSMEADGRRIDFVPLLAAHGYSLQIQAPVLPDPTLRQFIGVGDHFHLFRRHP